MMKKFTYFDGEKWCLTPVESVYLDSQFVNLFKKDEQLVVLPCKLGDTVWTNVTVSGWYLRNEVKPYSTKVVFIGLNDSNEMRNGFINVVYEKNGYMKQFNFSDIGETVFLTREEAEISLKKGIK